MNNIFNIDNFIDSNLKNINLKKKVSKQGKLNLASNELLHSKLKELNNKFKEIYQFDTINSYTFYPDKIRDFSELLGYNKENIALFAGSDDAIKIIINSIGCNSKNLIIQTPNYENYYSYAKLKGINIYEWNIGSKYNFYVYDCFKILREKSPSLVIISNPNGFTGKSLKSEEINYLLKECEKNGHLLIIDCAYSSFDAINYKELMNKSKNLIIINSLSKSYGLAGVRFAYIYSSIEIIKYLNYFNGINAISSLTYEIAEFYLKNKEIFNEIKEDIIRSRENLIKFIRENTTWNVIKSKSNFILIEMENKREVDKFDKYLNDNGIIARNLSNKKEFDKCIRMTVAEECIMNNVKSAIINFQKRKV